MIDATALAVARGPGWGRSRSRRCLVSVGREPAMRADLDLRYALLTGCTRNDGEEADSADSR
jgi:hypothetical protein